MTVDIGRLVDWPAEQIVIRGRGHFTCAVFSHNSNLIASVGAVFELLGHHLSLSDTFLAYLPLAHILEYIVELNS